ncbi:MAG: LacI family DNA-binding transcriptional regulator [Crocinitomicaceae bacterium]|nr:LacI family DNA-binding transcriptional regulator [Crocinitomicaceae bacterium]
MKKASLKDIAESLGVSKALVSLVLNGKGDERGINRQTQEK